MKREDITFIAAAAVSLALAIPDAGCIPGLIIASALNVLMIFPLTMLVTLIPYLIYFFAGKKAKFPAYYYALSLFLVTLFMLPRHF